MAMKLYVVRIQADTREDQFNRYREYPSPEVYDSIWRPDIENRSSLQNGFHECVNFKNFNGKIQGYLPPKPGGDSDWIEDDDVVCFIFVTNKSYVSRDLAKKMGLFDAIVGIQVGCKKVWKENDNEREWYKRIDVPEDLQGYINQKSVENGALDLYYQYECPFENSLWIEQPILNAAEILFPRAEHKNRVWGMNAVREIKLNPRRILQYLNRKMAKTRQFKKWIELKRKIMDYDE